MANLSKRNILNGHERGKKSMEQNDSDEHTDILILH